MANDTLKSGSYEVETNRDDAGHVKCFITLFYTLTLHFDPQPPVFFPFFSFFFHFLFAVAF